jgi:MoxR-like ATPase
VLRGRDYVLPDDVKAVAAPALGHRLTLKPELWVRRVRPEAIVADILETVAAPAAEDRAPTPE